MTIAAFRLFRNRRGSGRTEPVETSGIICPLGITEIRRAAGEGVGRERHPAGDRQIRGSDHDDGQVRGAGDVEPELICLYSETRAGLRLRIP